ncbi:unnamed protein product [Trypanosoma congolense IL3000]|uniref:WGS project CAEQ00000000 data, annotated contig 331 n=1 Tax=Trypanosoma congolense (strain IL3000) TaxID=1068625 RepID=F9WEZ5_TRYCI|nr:unnamed protein product [Trypanosoma congolense IL3000]
MIFSVLCALLSLLLSHPNEVPAVNANSVKPLSDEALNVVCALKGYTDFVRGHTASHLLSTTKEHEASAAHALAKVRQYSSDINAMLTLRGTETDASNSTERGKVAVALRICNEAERLVSQENANAAQAREKAERAAKNAATSATKAAGAPNGGGSTGLQQLLDRQCGDEFRGSKSCECVRRHDGGSLPDGVGAVDCTHDGPKAAYKRVTSAKMAATMEKWESLKPSSAESKRSGCRGVDTTKYLCAELEGWVPSFRECLSQMTLLERALEEAEAAKKAAEHEWAVIHHLYTEIKGGKDSESAALSADAKRRDLKRIALEVRGHAECDALGLSEATEVWEHWGPETEGEKRQSPEAGRGQANKSFLWLLIALVPGIVLLISCLVYLVCICRRKAAATEPAGGTSTQCEEA